MSGEEIVAISATECSGGKHLGETKHRYTWTLSLSGQVHTIEFTNSKTSGKKRIFVDDNLLFEQKVYLSGHFQHAWSIGQYSLSIAPRTGGRFTESTTHELRINGMSFESYQSESDLGAHPRRGSSLNDDDEAGGTAGKKFRKAGRSAANVASLFSRRNEERRGLQDGEDSGDDAFASRGRLSTAGSPSPLGPGGGFSGLLVSDNEGETPHAGSYGRNLLDSPDGEAAKSPMGFADSFADMSPVMKSQPKQRSKSEGPGRKKAPNKKSVTAKDAFGTFGFNDPFGGGAGGFGGNGSGKANDPWQSISAFSTAPASLPAPGASSSQGATTNNEAGFPAAVSSTATGSVANPWGGAAAGGTSNSAFATWPEAAATAKDPFGASSLNDPFGGAGGWGGAAAGKVDDPWQAVSGFSTAPTSAPSSEGAAANNEVGFPAVASSVVNRSVQNPWGTGAAAAAPGASSSSAFATWPAAAATDSFSSACSPGGPYAAFHGTSSASASPSGAEGSPAVVSGRRPLPTHALPWEPISPLRKKNNSHSNNNHNSNNHAQREDSPSPSSPLSPGGSSVGGERTGFLAADSDSESSEGLVSREPRQRLGTTQSAGSC